MRFPLGKESFVDCGVYEFVGLSQVGVVLSQVSVNFAVDSNSLSIESANT